MTALKTKEEVCMGIGQWLKNRQSNLDQERALHRVTHYVEAMPAWAD